MLGLFKHTWLLWVQISQVEVENSSKSCWFVMSHDNSSSKSTKVRVLRHCHCESSSQTTSNSLHDHRAWSDDSGICLNRSHIGLSMIVWRTRFSFVGRELRHALHTRFLILLGTWIDQSVLHRWLSFTLYSSSSSVCSSAFRNLYPNLEL